MPDPIRRESDGDTEMGLDSGSTTGTPRWVKVFGIVLAIIVLLVVLMMLLSGGKHGPGRHMSSGGAPVEGFL